MEELSESLAIEAVVRQGCVMSPWLFSIFMDGCMRKMKAQVGNVGVSVGMTGMGWFVVACLLSSDTTVCREYKGTSQSNG